MDRNHAEIVKALRACGWLVEDTSRLQGFVDLVCAKAGRLALVEVKDGSAVPSARKLTRQQADLHVRLARYGVPVVILTSVEDVRLL